MPACCSLPANRQGIKQSHASITNPSAHGAALAPPQHLASAQCAPALQTVRGTRHACPVHWTSQHLRGRRFRRTNHDQQGNGPAGSHGYSTVATVQQTPALAAVRACHNALYAMHSGLVNPRNACPSCQLWGMLPWPQATMTAGGRATVATSHTPAPIVRAAMPG